MIKDKVDDISEQLQLRKLEIDPESIEVKCVRCKRRFPLGSESYDMYENLCIICQKLEIQGKN